MASFSSRNYSSMSVGIANTASAIETRKMMRGRDIVIDHMTHYRGIQHYAPELKMRLA